MKRMTSAALSALISGDAENARIAMTPGGIEAQEQRGQIEQTMLETLPIEGTKGEQRQKFEALGFVFGASEDGLFVDVQFPKGWRKKPTEHPMWTDLIDESGVKRFEIFYKAAFYDRSAFIRQSN